MDSSSKVETSTGAETQSSVDFGPDGKGTVTTHRDEGLSMVAGDPAPKPPATPPTSTEVQDAIAKEIAEADAEAEAEERGEARPEAKPEGEGTEAQPTDDLGEFKPEDPETLAKFDERYFSAEGRLNRDALSAEFWANAKEGSPGSLHESTYAYLEHRLGVSKDTVKDIEAGLIAKHQAESSQLAEKVYAAAGDKDTYNAAIAWASAGGYTEAQGDRLNKLIQGQAEGWEDAVEALVSRYQKANPNAVSPRKVPPGPPQRRASSPQRQAGTEHRDTKPPQAKEEAPKKPADGEGKPAPYENADAYHADLKAAGNDPVKLAEVRARLRISPRVWS